MLEIGCDALPACLQSCTVFYERCNSAMVCTLSPHSPFNCLTAPLHAYFFPFSLYKWQVLFVLRAFTICSHQAAHVSGGTTCSTMHHHRPDHYALQSLDSLDNLFGPLLYKRKQWDSAAAARDHCHGPECHNHMPDYSTVWLWLGLGERDLHLLLSKWQCVLAVCR